MFQILTLTVAGALLATPQVSGISGLPHWPGSLRGVLHHRAPMAVDSLPPAWKPASRLVLEDQFVLAALPSLGGREARLKLAQDPRRLRVGFDPDSGRVEYGVEFGDVTLGQPVSIPVSELTRELTRLNFERLWRQTSHDRLNMLSGRSDATSVARSGLSFQFPSPLPARIQSLLGPGGPALNVSGSQQIRLSGTSNWTNQQIGVLGQRRSLFPSLDMQQDLNIVLEGQLSDRVRVNLLQNSAVQIPLANRIAINYKGDEDDLIQELDLGNTNLTLPGTQYVSYSGRNEGLFGAKVASRLGPLDFTMLASKQEGRSERASYAGGSQQQQQEIGDLDYVRGVYYFLYDPSDSSHDAAYRYEVEYPRTASIQLFLDEGTYANQLGMVRGRAWIDPLNRADTTTAIRGNFRPLVAGTDYDVMIDVYGPDYPVIRLKRPLTGDSQVLAVSYQYQDVDASGNPIGSFLPMGGDTLTETNQSDVTYNLKLLRAPQALLPVDNDTGDYMTGVSFNKVRDLELKNFYQLGGQHIDAKTFQLQIRRGDDQPYVVNEQRGDTPIPYIEILGLDNYDESSGGFTSYDHHGHDGKVDGTGISSNVRAFVNFEDGTLFFPDLRPFAPRLAADPTGRAFERAISAALFRRDSLSGPPDSVNGANPDIYDKRTVLRQFRRYTLMATFTAARAGGEINLGRTNIIEGSEVVTVNGQPLTRDKDYKIDYDLGKITLIKQLGPADNLNIDYGYAPLFQQAGRTLLGSSFSWQGLDTRFGGAFMYESRGASELRPRIGEEPSRSLIGDLNGEWHARPEFLTRLADALPGVRTTAPSDFNVSAEVGMSAPNPNTANQVYIDDMESVQDEVSLSMSPERWHWSSIPWRDPSSLVSATGAPEPRRDAEIHWYSPVNAIKERDLKPNLELGQGAQNAHQSLAISIPKRPAGAAPTDTLWAGLTYVLDPVGLDLSRSQFIELQVNDFRDYYKDSLGLGPVRARHVKLHIDIGTVSEDQQRAPNLLPNGRLDTEDQRPWDNQLSVTDTKNEDTGLDGLLDRDESSVPPDSIPDLVTRTPDDPMGDDFRPPNDYFNDYDPRKWLYTNGTEGDHTIVPVPETEDLNLNGALDTNDSYYEYTIDLGGESPFLIDSAYAMGRVYADGSGPVLEDNGWRHFRIPITDSTRTLIGSPDLALARHVRIWVDGVADGDPVPISDKDGRPLLVVGELSIVGSRWFISNLDSTAAGAKTDVVLSSVNSLDNADIYSPPFDPGRTVSGNQGVTRREQSIEMSFKNLMPSDSIEVYRTFSIDEDYSRYGTLSWYVTGHQLPGGYDPASGTLQYFVRFASDEQGSSYYEYRAPLPEAPGGAANWSEVRLTLTDLSNLKLDPRFPATGDVYYRVPGRQPGTTYVIKGHPSFTRLRRISFGLVNAGGAPLSSGEMWLDEMRALDIQRRVDHAQRVTMSGHMANLLGYNFNYNGTGPDFQSVGQSRGSGLNQTQTSFGANLDLHRFFEGTGIVLPVAYTYSGNRSTPRFTAGDDVVRTGPAAEASRTINSTQSWSASYSRAWSDRSNPFLRYTLGGITASIGRTRSVYSNPTSTDTSTSTSAAVGYQIAPRALLALPLPRTKTRLYLLPERFYWNYALGIVEDRAWSRLGGTGGTLLPSNFLKGRSGFIDFGASFRPLDAFHQEFQARRNLTLPEPLREQWGFINFGKVTQWRENWDTRIGFMRLPPLLRPSLTWSGTYQQNNGPELSPDLSVRSVANAQSVGLGYSLPLDRMLARLGPRSAASPAPAFPASPDTSAARDSTRRAAPRRGRANPVRMVFGIFGPIATSTRFTTNSAYTRLAGTPSLPYILGLSRDPGIRSDSTGRVRPVFGNASNSGIEWATTANTRLVLGYGSSITTTAEYGTRNSAQNGLELRSDHVRFPDLDVDYGRVPETLRLNRFLNNVRLHTAYGRSQQLDYQNSSSPTTISTSSEWRPLLGLDGDLKNGTRAELRIERRVTVSENRLFNTTINTDRNTDINFSMSRSYSQGQKVNFLGKTSTVRTNVSLGMSASYSRRSGDQRQVGVEGLANVQTTDRLSVNATGSYGFSNNMTGNLEFGFLQDRNLQTAIINRSVRIEVRGQLTF